MRFSRLLGRAGGEYLLSSQSVFVDAARHGALLDARGVVDAAVNSATLSTVTSATAAFTASDTGKTYVLTSTAGAVTTGTLTYVSATSCTMSVAAAAAMTGARLLFGTNDTTAWQAALDAALPGQVVDAAGFSWRSIVSGNLTVPNGVHLGFEGRGPFDPQTNPAINAWGPTFVMVQNATAFVTLKDGSGVGDLIFYSANQKPPASSAPTAYGAIVSTFTSGTAGVRIGSPYMPNAYIGIALRGGRHSIQRPQIGALLTGISLDQSLDVIDIDWITCSPYWRVCEGQTYTPTAGTLDEYAQNNAVALVVNRADGFKVGSIFCYGLYGALRSIDSAIVQSPECGYGMVGMIDADNCVVGIQAYETASPGILIGSALLGSNGTGVGTAGSAGVATMTGGSVAPKLVLGLWSHRGTWSTSAASTGAGTTLIVPATNPG